MRGVESVNMHVPVKTHPEPAGLSLDFFLQRPTDLLDRREVAISKHGVIECQERGTLKPRKLRRREGVLGPRPFIKDEFNPRRP